LAATPTVGFFGRARSPAVPRSWRVTSMKKFAPCRRPTLQAPPSVLVGMMPSGLVFPAATNGPLSPSPQKPRASNHCRAMKEKPS